MDIKNLIETHPLPILLGVIITAVSTTTGVVSYFDTAKFDIAKKELEIAYKSDVSALKSRLVSIERKLGNDEKTYFDISQLIITPNKVKELDNTYKSLKNGDFFYSQPVGKAWNYEFMSEGKFLGLKHGTIDNSADREILKILDIKNIHLWREDKNFTISPKIQEKEFEGLAPKSLTFFPLVSVQVISESELVSQTGSIISKLNEDKTNIDNIMKELDKLVSATKDNVDRLIANSSDTSIDDAPQLTEPSVKLIDQTSGEKKLEIEQYLATLYRGDLTAALLSGLITQSIQLAMVYDSTESALNSVQKKGNVLYVQMTLKFNSTTIEGYDKPTTLIIERELFIVTKNDKIYLVQVEIPTTDGRSEAYGWVGQWLSSIRIPI